MPFADLQDARIHYEFSGPESAPALVLSNSLGTDFGMWNPQCASFTSKFRLLRYDTRGHGKSSVNSGDYSIPQLANDVLQLLDFLKLDRVNFCGLSMGGQTGISLALNAPHRLQRLILCNTAAKIGTPDTWNARISAVRSAGMKEIAGAVIARWFTPDFQSKAPDAVSATQSVLESTNAQGYASCCAAVRDFDERTRVSTISLPTLVITGAHDPATPPADGRWLAEQIPGASCVELNAAHLSNIEAADDFTHAALTFLSH